MSKEIRIPILEKHDHMKWPIGELVIFDKDRLSDKPNYVFTLGYHLNKNDDGEVTGYTLLEVSPTLDENYIEFVESEKKKVALVPNKRIMKLGDKAIWVKKIDDGVHDEIEVIIASVDQYEYGFRIVGGRENYIVYSAKKNIKFMEE